MTRKRFIAKAHEVFTPFNNLHPLLPLERQSVQLAFVPLEAIFRHVMTAICMQVGWHGKIQQLTLSF